MVPSPHRSRTTAAPYAIATAVPRASGSRIRLADGINPSIADANALRCDAVTSRKIRSRGINGCSRAMVSLSSVVPFSIENSGLGRCSRLAGQKRVPRPPAIISAKDLAKASPDARRVAGDFPVRLTVRFLCGAPSLKGRCWGLGRSHRAQFFKFVFKDRADLIEALLIARLEPGDQRGLGVGGAHQAPSVGKLHPRAIDRDHIVMPGKIFRGLFHHCELFVVRTIDTDFRSEKTLRQVSENLPEPPALAANYFEQPK